MDGNGRWAKEKGFARTTGHREGMKRVREIVSTAGRLKVKFLTFFAFSTENWNRPAREINMLMRSLVVFLGREIKELNKNNMRFKAIGRKDPLPDYVIRQLEYAEKLTANNSGLTVILALNYGSRQEIVDAAKKFAQLVLKNEFSLSGLNEGNFGSFLYTKGIPDPDMLIRTSGEIRVSNFLLWQLSYSELYFVKKYWPDFGGRDLEKAIMEYNRRERRFGKVCS